jgi:hypothetical protein
MSALRKDKQQNLNSKQSVKNAISLNGLVAFFHFKWRFSSE